MKLTCNLFWFRRDVRLADNTGLLAAIHSGLPVLPVFVLPEQTYNRQDKLLAGLQQELVRNLESEGVGVLTEKGRAADGLLRIIKLLQQHSIQVDTIFCNQLADPRWQAGDQLIAGQLSEYRVTLKPYQDVFLLSPGQVLTGQGQPYRVFTHFYNKALQVLPEPKPQAVMPQEFFRPKIDRPKDADWNKIFPGLFKPEERGAVDPETARWMDPLPFLKQDFAAAEGEWHSGLGTALACGTLGIRQLASQVWGQQTPGHQAYLRRLMWREFFLHNQHFFPHSQTSAWISDYDAFPWLSSPSMYVRWTEGQTGFPYVDAGMRQLRSTGMMDNRVRMVSANFFCKLMLADYKLGEDWFARNLLDYEPALNNGNWQWSAGTGCDRAPYFRIFNPATQLQKFDPQLEYVKKWLPEYGTPDYPQPMFDYKMARERCLTVWKEYEQGKQKLSKPA
jgi:deoxyribodipyrimidine photo-lyase